MKKFRLSKIGWLILSAGVFIVVLIGLGITRSQQLDEVSTLQEQLQNSVALLEKFQTADLLQQVEDLQTQVEEEKSLLDEAKQRLNQTVVSADVTEKFFDIARYSNVEVTNISTSPLSTERVTDIELSFISIRAVVTGELDDIVDFVINLNHGYTTGIVRAVQVSVPEEGLPTGNVQMVIYSHEG